MKKSYLSEIKKSMEFLSKNKNTIFIGQAVDVPGNLIYKSLTDIPSGKKIETPIFEDTQIYLYFLWRILTWQIVIYY